MNASIYNSDSSALCKQVRHVGHKIDRAFESHSDIVSLRIISSLLQNRLAKLAGCLVSFRGGGGRDLKFDGLRDWGPIQHQLSSVPKCRQELLQHV